MKINRAIKWIGWLCLLLPVLAQAAGVKASLDRNSVQLGETATLSLSVDNASGQVGPPDLSVLNRDFDVLGTSQSNSLSIINGSRTAEVTFGVALRPKHAGTLQIPSLAFAGGHTTPLTLQVTAADPAAAAAQHQDVFMTASVSPGHGYVGQQLSYDVKLFYDVNLGGSLEAPQVDGADLSQVGDAIKYVAQRDGRSYHVLERRYALVPQHAGTLTVPALGFQGQVDNPDDPGGFFGTATPISTSAPAVSVKVAAAPSSWGSAAWLPARTLNLSLGGWPVDDQVRVGQPLNLSMKLQAGGVPSDALPALSLPSVDGATVYPDKPVSSDHDDGRWIIGQRQQGFAVVPTRAGTLTIPETTLKWWDVQTDSMQVARVPAHSIKVLPATGAASATPALPAAAASASSDSAAASAAPTAGGMHHRVFPWRWIALGIAALWLLSALASRWWRRHPRRPAPATSSDKPRSLRQYQLAFLAAARGSDSAEQVRTLLAWARAERPGIQHLGELARALGDPRQQNAINALQQRRYAGAPQTGETPGLAEAFKPGLHWRADGVAGGDDLPPLYPFKLK